MSVSRVLGHKGFWQVNKTIAKALKCNDASLLLSELVDKHEYYKDHDKLSKEEYFYATSDDIEESINLSYHQQKHAIAVLENVGFIETKLMGIPAKQHFKIIDSKIWTFFNTGFLEYYELDVEVFKTRKKLDKEQKGRKKERPVQPSHSSLSPIDLKIDGIDENPTKPSEEIIHSKYNEDLEIKSLQLSLAPQPPDVEKISTQMFNLLRKRVPKIEMSEILDSIDIDLPVLSAMFTEYWLFQKGEKFNTDNWKGLVGSFKRWIDIARTKEIPEKEVKEGLHTNPLMDKIVEAIKKRKLMQFTPQDAQKVNKFMRETNPSEPALRDGTDSFLAGQGKEWDHWIKAVKGAIGREQMGEL